MTPFSVRASPCITGSVFPESWDRGVNINIFHRIGTSLLQTEFSHWFGLWLVLDLPVAQNDGVSLNELIDLVPSSCVKLVRSSGSSSSTNAAKHGNLLAWSSPGFTRSWVIQTVFKLPVYKSLFSQNWKFRWKGPFWFLMTGLLGVAQTDSLP